MQTRVEYAAHVENNDFVVKAGEVVGYVYSIADTDGDHIVFDVVDDDGEHVNLTFAPFDPVTIVESFLDGDESGGEEVFIEV